jgi:hypothetical protein
MAEPPGTYDPKLVPTIVTDELGNPVEGVILAIHGVTVYVAFPPPVRPPTVTTTL